MPKRVWTAVAAVLVTAGLGACSPRLASAPAKADAGSSPAASTSPSASAPTSGSASTSSADAAAAAPAPTTRLLAGPARIITRRVAMAGGSHTITEIVPPVTDPDVLPVVYLLHGLPGQSTDLCSPTMASDLIAHFRAGQRPYLLACPDGNPSANDDSEWADSADGRDRLETFVTSSAVNAVEGSHLRSRTDRAIGGFSMGGFGAATIALRHPQLYGQVVTLAGYFHLDDPSEVFGTSAQQQAQHDPTALIARAPALRWYLAEAADDSEDLTAHDSERFAALLAGVGASHHLAITAGGHDLTWAVTTFIGAGAFLDAGWPSPS